MRTTFSKEEITELMNNPCVFNCTKNFVHYTFEFKRSALDLYEQGVGPKEIWRRAGLPVGKWNKNYFVLTLRDWKRIVVRSGEGGLNRLGGLQYDRGPNKEEKDKIKRLELQVKYLRAENDFLAKLRAKRAERNSGRTKNTGLYEI
jgi:hypothetical protein